MFYHGTDAMLYPGDRIEPGHPANFDMSDPNAVCFSTDAGHAATFGVYLYEVTPNGLFVPDGATDIDFKCAALTVLREADLDSFV